MRLILFFIAGFMSVSIAHAASEVQPNNGWPVPWPFPWAKDCPVNWAAMEGRYVLADDSQDKQIDIKMTILTKNGMRMVRIARYTAEGQLISDGLDFVSADQKVIRLYLNPRKKGEAPIWAVVKLHYFSWDLGCTEDRLVPILTIGKINAKDHRQTQYRLVRVPAKNR